MLFNKLKMGEMRGGEGGISGEQTSLRPGGAAPSSRVKGGMVRVGTEWAQGGQGCGSGVRVMGLGVRAGWAQGGDQEQSDKDRLGWG